ncbi:MAG: aminotransferase class V-fold PLP-dependent enzyme, partial [Nanoarchaeota archaeon]|nr:aminotransferase class V-fold PLP-dependent enzyme [Nanoarchaeota archaeon]
MKKTIYLDNGASTKTDPKVVEEMLPYFTEIYGNPSSIYSFSEKPKEAIAKARKIIASRINANPEEIIFTSGGSEADNLALRGTAYAVRKNNN